MNMSLGHEKGDHDGGKETVQPLSYSLSKAEAESEHEKPLLGESSHNQSNGVVTKEPGAINNHTAEWSPSLSNGRLQRINDSSLVDLESDDEDESLLASTHATSAQQASKQLSFQLARDGYRLDQMPDDDQIDLFPSRDFNHPPACCQSAGFSCAIS